MLLGGGGVGGRRGFGGSGVLHGLVLRFRWCA
jgi:hypothetical protein